MGKTASRVGMGIATMGTSELAGMAGHAIGGKLGRGITGFSRDPLHAVVKQVGRLFTPKTPGMPQQPSSTPAVQQAIAEAATRRSKARGYMSTILSQNFQPSDPNALKQTFGS